MAASRVCTVCCFRLANYVTNPSRLTKSQKLFQRLQPCATGIPSCNVGSHYLPSFYDVGQKVKENETRTGVETSTEEWKYVERLIPPLEPPVPPKHESYPTPSGWAPPSGPSPDTPYHVRRTKNHQIPVYRNSEFGGTRQLTVIAKVDGDIWALAKELKDLIESREDIDMEVPFQVNEYSKKIWFKGIFDEEITKFIKEKGF